MSKVNVQPPKQEYAIGKCDECHYESAIVRVHKTVNGDIKHCIFCEHPRHERISWGLNLIYEQTMILSDLTKMLAAPQLKIGEVVPKQ